MQQKIGFWPLFALVTGSQIGSGVFMLPSILAPYGLYAIAGWILSGIGAIALAIVFAHLCQEYPETGGPHVYVEKAFGKTAAFFVGWTYWIISWVSSTVVFAACVGYLSPLFNISEPSTILAGQIILLIATTGLNLGSIDTIGKAESLLTSLKFIPLLVIPTLILYKFSPTNFMVSPSIATLPTIDILNQTTVLTLWGFIGLESATASAGFVENPRTTIPLAIITGTITVAALYIFNSISIMGALPHGTLINSVAPYADAVQSVFGGNWHLIISLISGIVCLSTVNAWTLTSGQIALGLAKQDLLPPLFKKTTPSGAPAWPLIISCIGMIPLLYLLSNQSLAHQVNTVIDFSVTSFLFIYLTCCAACIHLLYIKKSRSILLWGTTLMASFFCIWIIMNLSAHTLLVATLFTISGVPMYLYQTKKKCDKLAF